MFLSEFIVHIEAFDNMEFPWSGCAWHWENQAFWNTVCFTVTKHSNRLPFLTSRYPVSHVVDGCWTCWGSWWSSSDFNNLCTSLLYSWYEYFNFPVLWNKVVSSFSFNSAVSNIWVHGWRMISPDRHFMDIIYFWVGLKSKLSKCSVVIKSGPGSLGLAPIMKA